MDHRTGPGRVAVSNETQASLTRFTKGGKQLRYDLRIIQQPERARACGAGAKASADRRPVDPPPILQLQIWEIMPNGEQNDVTFTMHANYFLFAMLERSRNHAQPRNCQDNGKNLDVLTGTNVTGMQPFDRPIPAIYFIFPDLSVRHEGEYRLLFSLYEDVRRTEDEDRHDMNAIPEQHLVTHRLDVRTKPFSVFSAKKFPGLTESTPLSRTFAEQGSRIRIRRDVRMRRRDNKSGKDWDEYDEDNSQMQRLSQTPEAYSAHSQIGRQPIEPMQRPQSSGSQHMMQTVARRPSASDLNQQYHQTQLAQTSNFAYPGTFSQPAPQAYTQASVLHPPPQMPTTNYNAASAMLPQQNYNYTYAAPAQNTQALTQMSYGGMPTTFDNTYPSQRSSGDFSMTDSRRASVQQIMPHAQQILTPVSTHGQVSHPAYPRQDSVHQHHSSIDSGRAHAPPEPVQPPTRVTTPSPPSLITKATFGTTLPPLSTSFPQKLEASAPSSAVQTNYNGSLPTPTDSHKRSYGSSFPTSWQNAPSKQGTRPNDVAASSMFLAADTDDGDVADLTETTYMGSYRRAGGHTVHRHMP